jgi:hypothetical protein
VKVIISLKLGPDSIEGAEENAVYIRGRAQLAPLTCNAIVLETEVRTLRCSNFKSASAIKVLGTV